MAIRGFHSVGVKAGLDTNQFGILLGAHASYPTAERIPSECNIGAVRVRATALAGGASALTWYLSEDATGDLHLGPTITTSFEGVTAGVGSFLKLIDPACPYRCVEGSTQGSLWLQCLLNAGTADIVAILNGRSPK